jgi:hypothetical protein
LHPARLVVADDLRRSRLTVFFRPLLVLPHFLLLALWGYAGVFALIGNWFVALFRGRPSNPLHRFLAAYLRYLTHVMAYLHLVANPFPVIDDVAWSYPIDLDLPARPAPQSRLSIGFRVILAVPAILITTALQGTAQVAAILSWFYALARGRVPRGLRNLGAYSLRYSAQTNGYLYLLTDRYPYAGPVRQLPPMASPAGPGPVSSPEI